MHRKQRIIFAVKAGNATCVEVQQGWRGLKYRTACVYMFREKLWALIGPLHVNRCTIRRGPESREGQQSRGVSALTGCSSWLSDPSASPPEM